MEWNSSKSAELPEPQAEERRGRVVILLSAAHFQVRTGDRDRAKAVILKGKTSGAKQLRGRPEARCIRRRDIAELPLDLLHHVERLVDPQCQHRMPGSR